MLQLVIDLSLILLRINHNLRLLKYIQGNTLVILFTFIKREVNRTHLLKVRVSVE